MQFKNLLYFCNNVHFDFVGIMSVTSNFMNRQFSHCNGEESFLEDRSLALFPHKAQVANTRPVGRIRPPPCSILPSTLFLPSSSAELLTLS